MTDSIEAGATARIPKVCQRYPSLARKWGGDLVVVGRYVMATAGSDEWVLRNEHGDEMSVRERDIEIVGG